MEKESEESEKTEEIKGIKVDKDVANYILNLKVKINLQEIRIDDLLALVDDQKESVKVLEKKLRSEENQKFKLLKLIEKMREIILNTPFVGRRILRKIDNISLLLDEGTTENMEESNFRRDIKSDIIPIIRDEVGPKGLEQSENQKNK